MPTSVSLAGYPVEITPLPLWYGVVGGKIRGLAVDNTIVVGGNRYKEKIFYLPHPLNPPLQK
jgi:hypothetical protein